jgi:hypothetical protein
MKKKLITKETGRWNKEKWSINYSDILSTLIKEAAKCEKYASDLFIDWLSLNKRLEDREYTGENMLFGFRDMGVDHTDFVKVHLTNGDELDKNYNSIYELVIKTWVDEYDWESISFELYKWNLN